MTEMSHGNQNAWRKSDWSSAKHTQWFTQFTSVRDIIAVVLQNAAQNISLKLKQKRQQMP